MDMNDRALRHMAIGLGGPANGVPREGGFDIVAASEVMAILCLARSLADLKQRLGRIVVAETRERQPVTAADLRAHGAMAVLLKDALAPNLVQTLENNPALLHGGPFGNIAHGCNSVIATRAAMKLGDYAITEAGFGADLGAEKFFDIKCRVAGLQPTAAVLVTTVRALKMQGGVPKDALAQENLPALEAGLANLDRHLHLVREVFGLPCVVAGNHFVADTAAEHALLRERMAARGVPYAVSRHWSDGGAGAEYLAREVVALCEQHTPRTPRFVYADADSLWDKAVKVAQQVYGAAQLTASPGKSVMMLSTPKSARRRISAGSLTVQTDTCRPAFCALSRRSGVHRVQFSASIEQPWWAATLSGSSQLYSATRPRDSSGVRRRRARNTSRELLVTVMRSLMPKRSASAWMASTVRAARTREALLTSSCQCSNGHCSNRLSSVGIGQGVFQPGPPWRASSFTSSSASCSTTLPRRPVVRLRVGS